VILADTSVWVDHLRRGNAALAERLNNGEVVTHEFVLGELLLGHLRRKSPVIELLAHLPSAPPAIHDEVVALVRRHRLEGAGLGWVDAHLLASALQNRLGIWTLDRRLRDAAEQVGVLEAG
jgi:predicted nucleic acid-binding protein